MSFYSMTCMRIHAENTGFLCPQFLFCFRIFSFSLSELQNRQNVCDGQFTKDKVFFFAIAGPYPDFLTCRIEKEDFTEVNQQRTSWVNPILASSSSDKESRRPREVAIVSKNAQYYLLRRTSLKQFSFEKKKEAFLCFLCLTESGIVPLND